MEAQHFASLDIVAKCPLFFNSKGYVLDCTVSLHENAMPRWGASELNMVIGRTLL